MSDTRDKMQELARTIETILPPHTGFIVLAFDHGKPGGRLECVSNSRREDVCRMMMEFVHKSIGSFGRHEAERLLTKQFEVTEEQRATLVMALEEFCRATPEVCSRAGDLIRMLQS